MNIIKFSIMISDIRLLSTSDTSMDVVFNLCNEEMSREELLNTIGCDERAFDRLLPNMKSRGLIDVRKEGRFHFYSASRRLKDIVSSLITMSDFVQEKE